MPSLTNARHELFASALAGGKSPSDAYVLAGFRPNSGNASRLKAEHSVQQRVAEIQTARRVVLTRNDILGMLLEDRCDARAAKQYGVAVKCDQLLGQELHAMFVERKELVVGFGEVDSIRELVEKAHRELGQKAAAALLEYHKGQLTEAQDSECSIMSVMRTPSEPDQEEVNSRDVVSQDSDEGQD